MTSMSISAENKTTRFQKEVKREYVREGVYGPYIGNDQNAIIQTNSNLKKISLPLIGKLKGQGVKGSAQLAGSEQTLSNYAQTCQPTYFRNGVLIDNEENELAEFDLFSEGRPALMNWTMELKRDQISQALGAVQAGGVYLNYGGTEGAFGSTPATAGNLDTYAAANEDRILYGNAKSNFSGGNHTTALATIDTTNDKLTAASISLLKRMAKQANPLIRPYMLKKNGTPWFVYFVGSFGFRDLKTDSTIAQANREARPRNVMDNPIFVDGDLLYDGVIIKEVPDLDKFIDGAADADDPYSGAWGVAQGSTGDSLLTAGDGGSRVGVGFLCGAQAIAFLRGRNASFNRRKEDDYGHLSGVGITMKHDIKKTFYNNKQHGMITHFHSAAVDV